MCKTFQAKNINVGHTLLLCVYMQATSIPRRILVGPNRLPQATIHWIKLDNSFSNGNKINEYFLQLEL